VTVHVISVGISILTATDDPRAHKTIRNSPDLLADLETHPPGALFAAAGVDQDRALSSDWLARALQTADTDPRRRLSTATRRVRPHRWPRSISAELDTFDRVNHRLLEPADIAVLICSDTPRGLLAGLWNAIALTRADTADDIDLSRVAYLADPPTPLGPIRGRAVIVRLPGMDAGLHDADTGMSAAMRGLGILAGHLVAHGDVTGDELMRYYLSGGYKAAIPYLIGMAEGVRSLPGGRRVEAVVLHEESSAAAIRLPLRCIDPDLLKQELVGFDTTGRCLSRPTTGFLDGYAYQRDGDRWRLTSFGHGLKALFGTVEPGLF
jgi:hypothetical protein